jgi:hypothetical protein
MIIADWYQATADPDERGALALQLRAERTPRLTAFCLGKGLGSRPSLRAVREAKSLAKALPLQPKLILQL